MVNEGDNVFDLLVLEQLQEYHCGHSRTRGAPKTEIICGTRGIALTPSSGQQGYFEARVRSNQSAAMWIGVSTFDSDRSLKLGERLVGGHIDIIADGYWPPSFFHPEEGGIDGSIMWAENGHFFTSLFGVGGSRKLAHAKFKEGDTVGIMICCLAAPSISFCRNGVVVHEIIPSEPEYLLELHPAFPIYAVQTQALSITPNPTIPDIEEELEEE